MPILDKVLTCNTISSAPLSTSADYTLHGLFAITPGASRLVKMEIFTVHGNVVPIHCFQKGGGNIRDILIIATLSRNGSTLLTTRRKLLVFF